VTGNYASSLRRLRTPGGGARLLLLFVVCVGEWVIGVGWLIGALLWHLGGRGFSLCHPPPGTGPLIGDSTLLARRPRDDGR
jgi:hypothetical protein